MKEFLSLFTFGLGAFGFVLFFAALKPLTVTAASGSDNPAYCGSQASPGVPCQSQVFAAISWPHVGPR